MSEVINEFMTIKNLNCRELAKSAGLNTETLRRCKKGLHLLSLENALAFADFMPCSLNYLVGKTDIPLDFTLKERTPFFDNLREIMRIRGINFYQLCYKTRKINSATYYGWRDGKSPQLETLVKLADYFNCTLDMLAGREQISL